MKDNYLEGKLANSINFLYTVLLWLAFYFLLTQWNEFNIFHFDVNVMLHDWTFYTSCILYLIYLILQFSTTGFRKFIKVQDIRTILETNIENKFSIKFQGKAWHFTEEDMDGNRTKINTFNKSIKYDIKSGGDYSYIIIDSNFANNKKYLDLEIEYDYICVDIQTEENHDNAFENFKNLTKNKDVNYSVNKIVEIPKAHSKNIISLTSNFIMTKDRILFIISIFLTLGQFYKFYISKQINKRIIKVTKIISNYYDLTQDDHFFNIQPFVKLNGDTLKYNRKLYTFKNEEGLEVVKSELNPLTNKFMSYDSKILKLYDNIQTNTNENNKLIDFS